MAGHQQHPVTGSSTVDLQCASFAEQFNTTWVTRLTKQRASRYMRLDQHFQDAKVHYSTSIGHIFMVALCNRADHYIFAL